MQSRKINSEKQKGSRSFKFDLSSDIIAKTNSKISQNEQPKKKKKVFNFQDDQPNQTETSPYEDLYSAKASRNQEKSHEVLKNLSKPEFLLEQIPQGKLQNGTTDTQQEEDLCKNAFFSSENRVESILVHPKKPQPKVDPKIQKERSSEEEASFSEELCFSLLGDSTDKFREQLKKLNSEERKNIYSEKAELYFSLFDFIENYQEKDAETEEEKVEFFQKWSSKALALLKKMNVDIKFEKISKTLYHVLSNTVDELVNQLLVEEKEEEAYAVSTFRGRITSQNPPFYFLKFFQKQYNLVTSESTKLLSKSLWIFDLAFIIKYFTEIQLDECLNLIVKKYKKSEQMPCQFMLLNWYLSSKNKEFEKSFGEKSIKDLLEGLPQHLSTEHVFILHFLRQHKEKYPSLYHKILEIIMKKIKEPKIYIQLLTFSKVSPQKTEELLKVYTRQNYRFISSTTTQQTLRVLITTAATSVDNKQYYEMMKEWFAETELKKLFQEGKYIQFLHSFEKNYQLLCQSSVVDFGLLLDNMAFSITFFKAACRINRKDKIEFYQVLDQISRKIKQNVFPRGKENIKQAIFYIDLLDGSKAFVELQTGIFNLNDQTNVKKIESLTFYLRNRADITKNSLEKTSSLKYLQYIEEIVMKNFESREGQIFLRKICESNDGIDKKAFVSLLPSLDCQQINRSFSNKEKQFTFIKILNIINCRKELKRKLMLLVGLN